ncbi:glutathione S-transferase family protein [Paracoccus sulfuroxidans]|uniref:Glutathione S-transferase n=1 Tax=Paracoccus sulfuroxidans TaxID=384678 RepID=A0A562NWY9_9RHOB|nr:glutathione S-transferase family protein [Paracoccus sulfuroxidans]TWI36732.1 glutathione S-transferase [Paracoccus sulfuroxidans]
MTTLYFHTGACSLGPHIVLEWIGAPYEAKSVEFGTPELLSVNPQGAVPVLVDDDGWTLTQAGAIVHYLARKHPEAGLGGDPSPRGQAEVDRWSSFLTGDLHPSFFPIFMPQRYTTSEDDAAIKATRAAGKLLVEKRLSYLDQELAGKSYILGERSVIDAYAFPMIRWASAMLDKGIAPYANVQAWFNRMLADEGVKRVMAAEGLK